MVVGCESLIFQFSSAVAMRVFRILRKGRFLVYIHTLGHYHPPSRCGARESQAFGDFSSLAPHTALTPTPELVRTGPRAGRGAHSHPPGAPGGALASAPLRALAPGAQGRRVVFSSVYLSGFTVDWRAITSLPPPALVRELIGHIVPLVTAVALDVSDP